MATPESRKKAQAAPMKGEVRQPKVDGFKISGNLKGTFKEITAILRNITFLEVAQEKDVVNVVYTESRDINKNPYLFSITRIENKEIEVRYSIPPEISPRKRRVDVIRYLLNILSLIEEQYVVDSRVLFQLLEGAVKELTSAVTMDYSKLYTSYDSIKKEVEDLTKKVHRLKDQTAALTTQNYELKSINDELKLRIEELEGLSDEALKAKLQEWIMEHNGSINVSEFTRLFKVSDSRVEYMLNKLVSEGYLEVVE
jgi:DNA repair ATPase RecN